MVRPDSEESCAAGAEYIFLAENEISADLAKEHLEAVKKAFNLQNDQVPLCDCKLVEGRSCYNNSCSNRKGKTNDDNFQNVILSCPENCTVGCCNKPFDKNGFAIDNSKLEKKAVNEKGFGLFAVELISKGEYIGEYRGKVLHDQLIADEKRKSYAFKIPMTGHIIDAYRQGSAMRFVNHSCEANCEAVYFFHDGKFKLVFIALKKIEPGTEVTVNYGWEFFKGDINPVCHCKSRTCTHFMGIQRPEYYGPPLQMPSTFDVKQISKRKTLIWTEEKYDPDFTENHLFEPLSSAFAVELKKENFTVSKCHVVKSFLNAHGLFFYSLQSHKYPEAELIVLPMFAVFKFKENAQKFVSEMSPKDSVSLLAFLNSKERTYKLVQQTSKEIVPDYVEKLRAKLIREGQTDKQDEEPEKNEQFESEQELEHEDKQKESEINDDMSSERSSVNSNVILESSESFTDDSECEELIEDEVPPVVNLEESENEENVDNKQDNSTSEIIYLFSSKNQVKEEKAESGDGEKKEINSGDNKLEQSMESMADIQNEKEKEDIGNVEENQDGRKTPVGNKIGNQDKVPASIQNIADKNGPEQDCSGEPPNQTNDTDECSSDEDNVQFDTLLSEVIHNSINPVMRQRMLNQATETVSQFLMYRLKRDGKDLKFDDAYQIVFNVLKKLYWHEDPKERRFLLFDEYRLEIENFVSGSLSWRWCSLCQLEKGFLNYENFTRHFYDHHAICQSIFVCEKDPCDFRSGFLDKFLKHVSENHADLTVKHVEVDQQILTHLYKSFADYIALRKNYLFLIKTGVPCPKGAKRAENDQKVEIEINLETQKAYNVAVTPSIFCSQGITSQVFEWDGTMVQPQNEEQDRRRVKQRIMQYKKPATKNFGNIYNCAFLTGKPDVPRRKIYKCFRPAANINVSNSPVPSTSSVNYIGVINNGKKQTATKRKLPMKSAKKPPMKRKGSEPKIHPPKKRKIKHRKRNVTVLAESEDSSRKGTDGDESDSN